MDKPKEINIVDYIPIGRENAISRQKLCELTGLNDRVLRKYIAKARETTCICNGQADGGGYYIPSTLEDANHFYKQERARALSVLRCLRGTKNFIRETEERNMYDQSFI